MEYKRNYNYVTVWMLDPVYPETAPTYDELYFLNKLPGKEKLVYILKNRYQHPENYKKLVIRLKTLKDNRKVLEKKIFDI